MSNEVWKEFEDNQITHSAAHYLMTIHELLQDQGYARVTDIAKRLNITRGSCSISLKPLKKRGLVVEDENRFLRLSDEGNLLAEQIHFNDQMLDTLFREVLGVDKEQAEIDACKIEHLLSIESSIKLGHFIKCWLADTKSVRDFKQELRKHPEGCSHDPATCAFCQSVCIIDEIEPLKG